MNAESCVRASVVAGLAALLSGCASTVPTTGPAVHGPILVQPLPPAPTSARLGEPRTDPHLIQYVSIPGTTPFYITSRSPGTRNALWFTTGDTPGSIGRLGPRRHAVRLFPLPPSGWNVSLRIVNGPDGNLWATVDAYPGQGGIARITPSGRITVYLLPTPGADLGYITVGSDGNLWFTEHTPNKFGRITPSGTITEFPFEDIGAPNGIINGPDGRLWICEQGAFDQSNGHQTFGRIERVNTDGKIYATYDIAPNSWQNVPEDITVGAGRKLWFTQFNAISQTIYEISNVTLGGTITQYDTPNANAGPGSPILAGDGNVWFTEAYAGQLGRIKPSGRITEFPLPQDSGQFPTAPYGLTTSGGKHLQIWFADYQNSRLGQFSI
ncbi:MAG: hypothetical protein WA215_00755 [Candidatus Cybelea sp.]